MFTTKMFNIITTLLLLFLQILLVFCQRNPTISYITREQIVNIGGSISLECSVQYKEDYSVLWVRIDPSNPRDSLTISSGGSLLFRDKRFSLRFEKATSTYTLQIKDIQESDAGTYQCQVVISLTNKITADVQVLVRMQPVIFDNSTRNQVTSEGKAVRLECYASGFPPPKILWRRENNAVLPTGGSIHRGNILNIPRVSKDDRGTYYCIADNNVGRGARRNINVEVKFAPVITVPRPRVGQALQYDADLECHVEAYPLPTITWIKDHVLSNNQHHQMATFVTADEYTDTTLRIITVEKRQYGEYKCKAANELGTAQANVELFETVVPVCPPACDVPRTGYYYGSASQVIITSACNILPLIVLIILY